MPTLATYRRRLGAELGGYYVGTGGVGGTSTVIGNLWTPFRSTALPSTHLAYWWAYVPELPWPNLRRVTKNGLDPATGSVTVDDSFSNAVANGAIVELSSRLPPTSVTATGVGETLKPSLNDCVNLALPHILIPDDQYVTVQLSDGVRDYSLSTWPWLDRAERLVDVRHLDAANGSFVSTWKTWELRETAAGNSLWFREPPRTPSGTYGVRLVVLRPAHTLISAGDSTVGLVNDTDTATPDLEQVTPGALAYAYRALRDRTRGPSADRFAALYEAQVREFRRVRNYDHSNDIDVSVSRDGTRVTTPAATGAEGA
jgi:hypothetical protein